MDWIQPLSELTLADIDRVGGKAAHLGAMLRAGFPVPPGFVIDVEAFVSHFGERTDPLVRPATPTMQAELMAAVVGALVEQLGDCNELAVRSSSPEEDARHASFAGQHATFYFVPPSQLDEAICDCWMSLWSDSALAYRRNNLLEFGDDTPVRMAVIVQKMLPASRAGVAFSRDPLDAHNKDCVIEACWGLGAALVDGRVSPDRYRVHEDGHLLSQHIADKAVKVSNDEHQLHATRLHEVPRNDRLRAVLNQEEAERIANAAHQLETLFECPQDVEWAYVDDELYLLQSRPITSRQMVFAPPEEPLVLFKPLAENFTEPLTPMTEDLFSRIIPKIGRFYGGRFYVDFKWLQRLVPFHLDNDDMVRVALLSHTPEKPNLSWPKLAGLFLAGSAGFLLQGAQWLRSANVDQKALANYSAWVARLESTTPSAPQLLRRLLLGRRLFEPITAHILMMNVSAVRYFVLTEVLNKLIARFAPEFPLTDLPRTYHGSRELQSLALVDGVNHLAKLYHDAQQGNDEVAQTLMRAAQGADTLLPIGHPFTRAFDAFLERFGHRGPREMELAAPRFREQPHVLLKLIADQANALADTKPEVHGELLAARDRLHQSLKPWQRLIVDRLIRQIGHFVALRENTRHYHIMAFDAARKKLLELEQSLIDNGQLRVAGDIFYLHYDEAEALRNHQVPADTLHSTIRQRRRRWQQLAATPPEQTLNIPDLDITPTDTDSMLYGQCACPGHVRGTARVIRSIHEAESLQAGDILVAPYTDPGWTPLFARAGGIIVGTGSFLSHAGTVARELHVPCVVDVQDCMQRIEDGQLLDLMASDGCVEVLA